jgi:predicted secreted hydrolase
MKVERPIRGGRGVALALLLLGASPATIEFPRDHGTHPDAAMEWWYYTGHLTDPKGAEYGFQVTFFRVKELYLAHFAWTDVTSGRFLYEEKTHLGLPGIAGAASGRLDVSNEDWSARAQGQAVRLTAGRRDLGELVLTLTPSKPPVLNGEEGLSRKGPGPNDYSHYVSITRFSAAGTLTPPKGAPLRLTGTAWFDHEWGPGALPEGAVGWDWFALQLSDGSDLMLYRMRLTGGSASPFSTGTFVPPAGAPKPIAWSDVALASTSAWTSPHSHATYPATWKLSVRSLGLETTITPLVAGQELATLPSTGVTYWEGACRVEGTRGGRPVGGRAYVEMTGYAGKDVPGAVNRQ